MPVMVLRLTNFHKYPDALCDHTAVCIAEPFFWLAKAGDAVGLGRLPWEESGLRGFGTAGVSAILPTGVGAMCELVCPIRCRWLKKTCLWRKRLLFMLNNPTLFRMVILKAALVTSDGSLESGR